MVRKWAARDHRRVWVKGIWEFWEFYELFLQLLVSLKLFQNTKVKKIADTLDPVCK